MHANCTRRRVARPCSPIVSRCSTYPSTHLTNANHLEVLDAVQYKSKRDVEQFVARLRPKPDVPAVVRKLPAPKAAAISQAPLEAEKPTSDRSVSPATVVTAPFTRPPEVKPLAPERFKVQFTVGRDTYEKLRQVQDLPRHSIPTGDPSAIFDRALTLLLAQLSKTKFSAAGGPRPGRQTQARLAPYFCSGEARGVDPRRRSMRVSRRTGPLRRNGISRVPPPGAVRQGRRRDQRQS